MSAPFAPPARNQPTDDQVNQHLAFVRRVVARMARRLPSHVQLDDLMGAGVVGLLEALDRYDSSRASDFHTFAEFRVKGAILDELRRRDIMARDARLAAKRFERAIEELTQRLGRAPEEEEIAAALDMSVAEYRAKLHKLTPVRVFSLDDALPGGLRDGAAGPFEQTARAELRRRLAEAIAELGERQQQVLQLYYFEELTLREVGRVLGVTESRVCQIVSEATLRLRVALGGTTDRARKKPDPGARRHG